MGLADGNVSFIRAQSAPRRAVSLVSHGEHGSPVPFFGQMKSEGGIVYREAVEGLNNLPLTVRSNRQEGGK